MRILPDLTTPMNSPQNRAAWFTTPFDLATTWVPQDVLAAHIGSGAIMLTWVEPNPGWPPDYYEVWASNSLAGTYYLYMNGKFAVTRGVVFNVPVGTTAYFKVRACTNEGGTSDFAQAMVAIINKPTIQVSVTAIEGTIIPSGAIFTIQDEGGRLVALSADSLITV